MVTEKTKSAEEAVPTPMSPKWTQPPSAQLNYDEFDKEKFYTHVRSLLGNNIKVEELTNGRICRLDQGHGKCTDLNIKEKRIICHDFLLQGLAAMVQPQVVRV